MMCVCVYQTLLCCLSHPGRPRLISAVAQLGSCAPTSIGGDSIPPPMHRASFHFLPQASGAGSASAQKQQEVGLGAVNTPQSSPIQGRRGGSGSVPQCSVVLCAVHSSELPAEYSPAALHSDFENAPFSGLSCSLSHCLHSLTCAFRHHLLNSLLSLCLWENPQLDTCKVLAS